MNDGDATLTLKDWRRSLGLTQGQLARLACVSRASISHVETGRFQPTPKLAGRLCRALSTRLGRELSRWELFPRIFRPLPSAALPAAGQTGRM
jgi:DNA-binding XRE family transcriptional regulator